MESQPGRGGWIYMLISLVVLVALVYTQLDNYAKTHLVVESNHLTRFMENLVECDGVVRNTGKLPVKNVQLRLSAVGPDGQTANSKAWRIDSDVLAPGATSTFNIDIRDPLPGQTRYEIRVDQVGFEWRPWNW